MELATLTVNSIPASAVWLDGTHVGNSPVCSVRLLAGSHRVKWIHPEFGMHIEKIDLSAGENRYIAHCFGK